MPVTQQRLLNNVRFNRIVRTLQMNLELERPLTWLERLNLTDADEDEISARFTGRTYAADIIANGQQAVVYEGWQLVPFSYSIPNLKHGMAWTQTMLNKLERFENGVQPGGENAFLDWLTELAMPLVTGNRQRQNALACAMFLDDLDYDRMGIKLADVSWGMPAALKVTVSPLWTDATNAAPLANIETLHNTAVNTHGRGFNRITSSLTDFLLAAATAEWRNRASTIFGAGFALAAGMLPTTSPEIMLDLFSKMKPGWTWVIDDATYVEKTGAGENVTKRVLPLGKVILDNSDDDGNNQVRDMANAVPTEAIVAKYIDNAPNVGGAQNGPIGYFTGRADLNPPDLVSWAVSRVWPRKFIPECSAVLTVQ